MRRFLCVFSGDIVSKMRLLILDLNENMITNTQTNKTKKTITPQK